MLNDSQDAELLKRASNQNGSTVKIPTSAGHGPECPLLATRARVASETAPDVELSVRPRTGAITIEE